MSLLSSNCVALPSSPTVPQTHHRDHIKRASQLCTPSPASDQQPEPYMALSVVCAEADKFTL